MFFCDDKAEAFSVSLLYSSVSYDPSGYGTIGILLKKFWFSDLVAHAHNVAH